MSPFSTSTLRTLRAPILMDVDLATKPMCIISRWAIDTRDPMETKRLKRDGNQGTWDAPPDDFGWIRMWFLGWKFWCLIVRCWLVVWLPFFIFPYIGNNHPNWLIFFRGVAEPPTRMYLDVSGLFPEVGPHNSLESLSWKIPSRNGWFWGYPRFRNPPRWAVDIGWLLPAPRRDQADRLSCPVDTKI